MVKCRNSAGIDDRLMLERVVYHQDREALAVLYSKYYPAVKLYIASHIGSSIDVEDLAGNVFLSLCEAKGRYDVGRSAEGYLLGIAKNTIRRYRRREKKSARTTLIRATENVSLNSVIQQRQEPGKQVQAGEFKRALGRIVIVLPPKTREAIILRFILGLSPQEAAEKVGCSTHTFCQRIREGINSLRKSKTKLDEVL